MGLCIVHTLNPKVCCLMGLLKIWYKNYSCVFTYWFNLWDTFLMTHLYTNCVPWKRALGFVWLCKHWQVFYMLGWIYQSLVASVKQDLYLGGWKSRWHRTMVLNVIWLRDIRLVVPAKRKNCSSQKWCYDGHICHSYTLIVYQNEKGLDWTSGMKGIVN